MPLVSVFMPSYNHDRYIAQAIESVQAQTISDWELIVIDDASRDESCHVIDHYVSSDQRIRKIFHETNMGISKTVNDGFDAAQGKYFALIASDDLWMPDKLEKQLEILRKNPDLVVWSDALVIDAEGNPTGALFTQKYHAESKPKSGDLFLSLSRSNYICGQSTILKTEVAQTIQFDPGLVYANDYKFMLELSRKCDFYFIDEPLVQYRIHGDNSITKNKDIWARDDYYLSRYLLTNYAQELSKNVIAKCYKQMGIYLHNQGHLGFARKCFFTAIRNNPRKTSYYKKFIKSSAQSLLS